ncbi:MAG: AmmeMemoRadiSam system radical SAM enzyme [bacterium]
MAHKAAFWEALDNAKVICRLCPNECQLNPGQRGLCNNRYNEVGELVTENYGEAVSLALDPIEKKPLYHFCPTSVILSTGPNGCNLACRNCQNWSISQEVVRTTAVTPERLVELAGQRGSIGVAFTYTEPLIWYEYIMDVAPRLQARGLKTVLVSNGYINSEPLATLLPFIDAANIDLKSLDDEFYRKICNGRVAPVLQTIRALYEAGIHLEVTTLLIPGLNDSENQIQALTDFLASVSAFLPFHLSAYHPSYKMDAPPTSAETLLRAKAIAQKKLKYVYIGNVAIPGASNTVCPECGRVLIERRGFSTEIVGLEGADCLACGFKTGIQVC